MSHCRPFNVVKDSGPRLALSVRQPWAWLIVTGHKPVENRSWSTRMRGPIFIHASIGMTREEYEACRLFALRIDATIPFPMPQQLEHGGIIGTVEVTGCVRDIASPWYVGEWGFKLTNPQRLSIKRCRGYCGRFFEPEIIPQLF